MLNCGLRMRPTAGTANGVHPVPAGFSRVYVDLGEEKFTPELWQKRLNEGHSFVTTGPLIEWQVEREQRRLTIDYQIRTTSRRVRVETIVNGDIRDSMVWKANLFAPPLEGSYQLAGMQSGWVAIRCFEMDADGRGRFAHTAPVFLDIPGNSLEPRRDQVRYLIQRCEEEIARNKDVLSEAELAEYREALEFYRAQLATAR
jgi:hypothetical protein